MVPKPYSFEKKIQLERRTMYSLMDVGAYGGGGGGGGGGLV